MKCWMVVALAGCILAATASPIIKPRPVDNTRDPHDGEPFEWEPVDDDPWPGPSFTFPQLPSTDALETGGRPSSSAGTQAQAAFLVQFLRALFNNNNNKNNNNNHNSNKNNVRRGGDWSTSANEVGYSSDWIRQKKP